MGMASQAKGFTFCALQAPLWAHWDDIAVGMKVEVLNTNGILPSKVYWIATVIQIAGVYIFNSTEHVCV